MYSEAGATQAVAISLESVSKSFQIYEKPHHRLMQGLFRGKKQFYREFKAVSDITFEIPKGETVGIIGRNGAGKSTLLQMICGTMTPTSGTVQINGRVAALLELGSGFNPEFTGRENVYMNGAILGLTRDEVEDRFDDIIAFAEIGDFIDQPVKTYSSGMFVRLAFAVNIMSKPEIMIVDEALSVGDMNFQAKCITALKRIQQNGATILFVSHDIGSVKSLCSRGIYLEKGKIKEYGTAADATESYIRDMREEMNQSVQAHRPAESKIKNTGTEHVGPCTSEFNFKSSEEFTQRIKAFRYGTGEVKVSFVELLNMDDEPIASVQFDQQIKIRIYLASSVKKKIAVSFLILDKNKNNITGASFRQSDLPLLDVDVGGQYLVEYSSKCPFQEGIYSIRIQVTSPIVLDETAEFIDVIDDAVVFQLERWEQSRIWWSVHLFPEVQVHKLK